MMRFCIIRIATITMNLRNYLVVGMAVAFSGFSAFGQRTNTPIQFSSGVGFVAPDSLFSLNFRFRTQLRAAYNTATLSDLSASGIEARVRRLRLRFEGFVVDPRLTYYIQLSFSRGDMDWVDNEDSAINSSPNVIRDAVIHYKPNKRLTLSFGQTKLPGNRQRVNSSSQLQFADRSIVNATFNIDRDFGFQATFQKKFWGEAVYVLKGAVTSGEGRNAVFSDGGLAYTGRLELLPFGPFTGKGDYLEGDLKREPSPKLSLAAGWHYNENAKRTAGTLGIDLFEDRNLKAFLADFLLKYRGFAVSGEYVNRKADNPITLNDQLQERIIYAGAGKMLQLSYIFKNNVELAGRYAVITPHKSIQRKLSQREETGVAITKYLNEHRVKLQGQIFYNLRKNPATVEILQQNWTATFQVELGI